jgi:serine protease AprX
MMQKFKRLICIALVAAAGFPSQALSSSAPPPPAKIAPQALAATQGSASAPLLVVLQEQADLEPAASLSTKAEKGRFVYDTLRQTAIRSQAPLRAVLDRDGVRYQSYYIVNMIELTGNRDLALQLAARPDVARIEANPQVPNTQYLISNLRSDLRPLAPDPDALQTLRGVEWNVDKINAPAAWALGYTGQGVVVAGADTGYQWDHPALKPQYRGWNGITVTHDYNWHDAIHDSSYNSCGNDSPAPCDDHGHGTHTMGTMVGDDGAGNQVGVAPGAQWIGCRNMAGGYGTPARYIECFEFFLAPYPVGGDAFTQGEPALAPAVIGNSWSCPTYEGCDALSLQAIVDAVRAAGIEVVAAAQNYGSSCSTVSEPIGIYASAFTVGATNENDTIAGFSSRGPVTADGSGRRKPDISAPGVSVRSAYPTNRWTSMQGTSMATPHVAGLFALVWSAAPERIGQLAATEHIITSTAVHLTTSQGCGGDTPTSVPNNVYGWGRIDALAAIRATRTGLHITATAAAPTIPPGEPLTFTLALVNPWPVVSNTNVVVTDTLPLSVTFSSASDGGIYSPAERMVTWTVPTLTAQSAVTFTLAVTVTNALTGAWIVNWDYGARSDQVTDIVTGPPVHILVGTFPFQTYLPLVVAPP